MKKVLTLLSLVLITAPVLANASKVGEGVLCQKQGQNVVCPCIIDNRGSNQVIAKFITTGHTKLISAHTKEAAFLELKADSGVESVVTVLDEATQTTGARFNFKLEENDGKFYFKRWGYSMVGTPKGFGGCSGPELTCVWVIAE